MADSVKTQVMKALETILQAGVTEVQTVKRRNPVGTDLERHPLPILFLYAEDEDSTGPANRLARQVIRAEIAVFAKIPAKKDYDGFTEFEDLADTIAARIHGVLHTPAYLATLRTAGLIMVEEGPKRSAIANETYGELVIPLSLTYGHSLGNAFTTQL